jgi:hypothetical protein
MGASSFHRDDYSARSTVRKAAAARTGTSVRAATFAYDYDVKAGKASGVHKSLNPHGVKLRESRDSEQHPITVPIIVGLDTTGSMQEVPALIQGELPKLMGHFLEDKASGKRYLGDGYPAIMIAAIDDCPAMGGEGALQVGQFESGIEIDNDLTNLWLTGNGGGTYEENYDLLLYFAAEHTAHDHWERRGRKGYLFLIGDEHPYDPIRADHVKTVIGDTIQNTPAETVLRKAQERYHVFMIIPNMTSHYHDKDLRKYWMSLVGQQNLILLEDPKRICAAIAGAVAICEEHIGVADLKADGVFEEALVPLAKSVAPATSVSKLPPIPGAEGTGVKTL